MLAAHTSSFPYFRKFSPQQTCWVPELTFFKLPFLCPVRIFEDKEIFSYEKACKNIPDQQPNAVSFSVSVQTEKNIGSLNC